MAAKLPIKYTGAVIQGSNICGTFTSTILIITDTFTTDKRKSAIYYFISALFVLLVCFDTYFALPLNVRCLLAYRIYFLIFLNYFQRFYRHYELRDKIESKKRVADTGVKRKIPYIRVFRQAFPQLFNVFFVFFITLSIFPAIQASKHLINITNTYRMIQKLSGPTGCEKIMS